MYVPAAFRVDDVGVICDFCERNPFGVLVCGGDALRATHVPFIVERDARGVRLLGHVARANPQWQHLEGEVLVIFTGPHAYVSPRWYASRDNVPTWDYMAVHAYGRARVFDDRARMMRLLATLAARFEPRSDPWLISDIDARRLEGFLAQIVGFEIQVTRWDAAFKLSQNRSEADRAGVVRALRAQRCEEIAAAIEGS
ncbi:MAG: FMN-binding negative transcriptional regulator [Candidatus Tyrphobacter sp.]